MLVHVGVPSDQETWQNGEDFQYIQTQVLKTTSFNYSVGLTNYLPVDEDRRETKPVIVMRKLSKQEFLNKREELC